MPTLYVRSKSAGTFNRCKRVWGREWTEADVSDADAKVLRAESRLEVRDSRPSTMDAEAKRRARLEADAEAGDREVGTSEGELPPAHGPSSAAGQRTRLGADDVPPERRRTGSVYNIERQPKDSGSAPTGGKAAMGEEPAEDEEDDEGERTPVERLVPVAARSVEATGENTRVAAPAGPPAGAPKTTGPAAGPKAAKANQGAGGAQGGGGKAAPATPPPATSDE